MPRVEHRDAARIRIVRVEQHRGRLALQLADQQLLESGDVLPGRLRRAALRADRVLDRGALVHGRHLEAPGRVGHAAHAPVLAGGNRHAGSFQVGMATITPRAASREKHRVRRGSRLPARPPRALHLQGCGRGRKTHRLRSRVRALGEREREGAVPHVAGSQRVDDRHVERGVVPQLSLLVRVDAIAARRHAAPALQASRNLGQRRRWHRRSRSGRQARPTRTPRALPRAAMLHRPGPGGRHPARPAAPRHARPRGRRARLPASAYPRARRARRRCRPTATRWRSTGSEGSRWLTIIRSPRASTITAETDDADPGQRRTCVQSTP